MQHIYHIAPKFLVQNFRENVENHANVNFRDKNFAIVHGEPTAERSNFCEKKFLRVDHKIYKNVGPRNLQKCWATKIWSYTVLGQIHFLDCFWHSLSPKCAQPAIQMTQIGIIQYVSQFDKGGTS